MIKEFNQEEIDLLIQLLNQVTTRLDAAQKLLDLREKLTNMKTTK